MINYKLRQLVTAMVLFRFQFQINADVSENFQYYFGATVNNFNIQFSRRSTLSSDVILQVETPFQNKLNVRDVGCKSNERKTKDWSRQSNSTAGLQQPDLNVMLSGG